LTRKSYSDLYSFKYTLKNTVIKLANSQLLDALEETGTTDGSVSVKYGYATDTGIVSYWTDGYEDLTADAVTADMFDERSYEKNSILSK